MTTSISRRQQYCVCRPALLVDVQGVGRPTRSRLGFLSSRLADGFPAVDDTPRRQLGAGGLSTCTIVVRGDLTSICYSPVEAFFIRVTVLAGLLICLVVSVMQARKCHYLDTLM